MICPVCKHDMIVVEHERIELDYCPSCRGVWFDAGELELLLGSLGLDSSSIPLRGLLDTKEAGTIEKKRKCPICRRKMQKAILPPEILVDVCLLGEGLWFDGGEVSSLLQRLAITQLGKSDTQGVVNFLREVFKSED